MSNHPPFTHGTWKTAFLLPFPLMKASASMRSCRLSLCRSNTSKVGRAAITLCL